MLLERENETLHAKVQALTHELARLRGTDASAVERQLALSVGNTSSNRAPTGGVVAPLAAPVPLT